MKMTILIEQLNDGYLLTINGKTKAVEKMAGVQEIISEQTKNCTEKFSNLTVKRSLVTIEFEENPPIIK